MFRLILRVVVALAVAWLTFIASRALATMAIVHEFRRQKIAVSLSYEFTEQLAPIFCFIFALFTAWLTDRLWNYRARRAGRIRTAGI